MKEPCRNECGNRELFYQLQQTGDHETENEWRKTIPEISYKEITFSDGLILHVPYEKDGCVHDCPAVTEVNVWFDDPGVPQYGEELMDQNGDLWEDLNFDHMSEFFWKEGRNTLRTNLVNGLNRFFHYSSTYVLHNLVNLLPTQQFHWIKGFDDDSEIYPLQLLAFFYEVDGYFSDAKKCLEIQLKIGPRRKITKMSKIEGGKIVDHDLHTETLKHIDFYNDEIERIENHKFDNIKFLFWRNSDLNFKNPEDLIQSLETKPKSKNFFKISDSIDENVLKYLVRDKKLKFSNDKLGLLWECCQIPDFQKKAFTHIEVVTKVFNFLNSKKNRIPNDYMKNQLKDLDKYKGNIDMISNKISNVRTWSYVANKVNWVENQDYWVERTKNLEDKLSDRLHEELTKSFIDKRASVLAQGLKQDITFKTKILENNKVLINNQFIGQLNGLKLELDLKVGALDTDIKSLKKAAKQNVEPEILNRIEQIKKTGLIELKDDFKIYWKIFPIAKLVPGKDYLKPEINLIIDDMIDNIHKSNFIKYLQNWINEKINNDLKSLTDLKNIDNSNTSIRALAYQLYENNGVIKREQVKDFLKNLAQEERKILRNLGVKFGRYHIFLFKLFKPNAVSLRIALWKNFHQKHFNLKPPTFGLNFLKEKGNYSKDFMLLCGFEKFDNFFVRIDILERLFIKIMSLIDEKNKEVKLTPEMLNLLGCNKEDFIKLIKKMHYYPFEKNKDTYFKYNPLKNNKKNLSTRILKKENPFNVLKNINFK